MTAMRLKRYPSPSGGFALGKLGCGNLLLNEEDYMFKTQLVVTQACSNMNAARYHLQSLLNASSVDSDANGILKIHVDALRQNAFAATSFLYRGIPGGSDCILRYRSGTFARVPATTDYDCDMRVGDVYDVYVLKKTEGWEQ